MNSSVRPATSEELDFLSAQKNSQFRETFLRLCQNRAAVAGMIFLIFLILMAVFADVLFDYQTTCVDQNIAERLQWPSAAHWFGTDQFGRDLLARIVRSAVLSVRDMEYVEAARAIGVRTGRTIFRYILPNCMGPIIVQTTLRIAATISNTAALSFLGLGVKEPQPEWGALLSSGREFIRDSGYLATIPGICIMLTILALNLLGDGLRDALDPRLK